MNIKKIAVCKDIGLLKTTYEEGRELYDALYKLEMALADWEIDPKIYDYCELLQELEKMLSILKFRIYQLEEGTNENR